MNSSKVGAKETVGDLEDHLNGHFENNIKFKNTIKRIDIKKATSGQASGNLSVDDFFETFFQNDQSPSLSPSVHEKPNKLRAKSIRHQRRPLGYIGVKHSFSVQHINNDEEESIHNRSLDLARKKLSPDKITPFKQSRNGLISIKDQAISQHTSRRNSLKTNRLTSREHKVALQSMLQPGSKLPEGVAKGRRYCIVDSFMYNTNRQVSNSLASQISRFCKHILDCEKDILKGMGFDNSRIGMFNSFPFFIDGNFSRIGYLHHCQNIIEQLIIEIRNAPHPKSVLKRQSVSLIECLKGDHFFLNIKRLFNFGSISQLLSLYSKYLLANGVMDKAEAVSKIALSVAYIFGSNSYKTESYFDLGCYYEKMMETELALFCYIRSMQMAMTTGNKQRESSICDKIGRVYS